MASPHSSHLLWPLALAVALAAVASDAGAAPGNDSPMAAGVQRELDRLEAKLRILAAAARPGPPPPQVARFRDGLERARSASAPSLRLLRLRDLDIDVETFAYGAVHREAGESEAAFERLWSEEGERFTPPAALRGGGLRVALGAAAQNRAEKLYPASRAYARVTSPSAGLHYLGQAVAQLQFRDLVRGLAPPPALTAEGPPAATRLESALAATERDVLAAFDGDRMRPTMVPVSASLEEARELVVRGDGAAAALTLFEARIALAAAHGVPARAPAAAVPGAAASASTAGAGVAEGSLLALLQAIAFDPTVTEPIRQAARDDALPLYDSLFGRD